MTEMIPRDEDEAYMAFLDQPSLQSLVDEAFRAATGRV